MSRKRDSPGRPRRGSIAFVRCRARRIYPIIRSWPSIDEAKLLGFTCYKAGMTHVLAIDNNPNSPTSGEEIFIPVTVLEAPPMIAFGIRLYKKTLYGLKSVTEVWADNLDKDLERKMTLPKRKMGDLDKIEKIVESNGKQYDLRVLIHTKPRIASVPKKKPEVMEYAIGSSDIKDKLEYCKKVFGKEIKASEVFKKGDLVDVIAVTKGKGTQGPIKRFGCKIQDKKAQRGGKGRHVGTLGPWTPKKVDWRIPQAGQTGYHVRTEYNKLILKIGDDGREVTPKGGFLHYGIVKNEYIMLKGSVPGTAKRPIRLRFAIRPVGQIHVPQITYISLESKQG